MLVVHPHGASPSRRPKGWDLLVAKGHIGENHQWSRCVGCGIGSTRNPDTRGLLPMDAIFDVTLPEVPGGSVTGAALKTALAEDEVSLLLLKKLSRLPTRRHSPHHPTIGAPRQHQQDGQVPLAEQIHDIMAVPRLPLSAIPF